MIMDIVVESEQYVYERWRVVIVFLNSPHEICSSISSRISVWNTSNAVKEVNFRRTCPKSAGSFHSAMQLNLTAWT